MLGASPPIRQGIWRTVAAVAIVGLIGGVFVFREFVATPVDVGEAHAVGVIDRDRRPIVGELAPDFAIELTGRGEVVTLSQFRGRTVLLNFWATWCPPCRAEMPEFQEIYDERLDDGDFVVIAVDVQESDPQVQQFLDGLGLTFPVGIDRDGAIARHFEVRGLPASFFIDRDSILRHRVMGPVFGDLLLDAIAIADAAGAGG